jgi:hypothetical protein
MKKIIETNCFFTRKCPASWREFSSRGSCTMITSSTPPRWTSNGNDRLLVEKKQNKIQSIILIYFNFFIKILIFRLFLNYRHINFNFQTFFNL